MKAFFTLVLFLHSLVIFSQVDAFVIDTVTVPTCKNILTAEYKLKFEQDNKKITWVNTAQKHIIKEIYTEIQDGFLDKINRNNFICSGTAIAYLNSLLQELLTKNNISAVGYKLLLSRDFQANAYNTGDGTIVVNYGTFLTVDSEDELVFIIAHEMGHQQLSHVKNDIATFARLSTSEEIITKTRDIRRQKYGKATMATDLLKSISYQNYSQRRAREIEADSLGLIFYNKTLRNPKAGITILEKLDAADDEKDSLTVADYKFIFDSADFKVKDRYFEEEVTLFKKYDRDGRINIDSLKTHPDCTTRIQLIKGYLHNTVSGNLSNSKTFSNLKQNSTYQNLLNLFLEEKYGPGLYEALKLYKKDAGNPVLKNIIYCNLTKLYSARVNYTINRYVPAHDNKKNTASKNRFISFINNIKITDLQTITNNFKS